MTVSRIARLQQAITLSAVGLLVLWPLIWWQRGRPGIALAGAAFVLGVHAIVLGLEFVLLHRLHRDDPAPPATPAQLLRAWWGEVLTAPIVFCWRQPFRWSLVPDHLPAAARGRRGVLFVHGFVCNRGLWNPWLRRLRAEDVPFVAVNLEPVFGSIDAYAARIEQARRRLLDTTGHEPVIVSHSMGGLAVRAWWRAHPQPVPHRVVTIASPHQGTWMGRFGHTLNARQMRLHGEWVKRLAEDETAERRSRITCFYSHCDNIVVPPSAATLAGADNRHLPGWSHVHLAYHPAVIDEVMRWVR